MCTVAEPPTARLPIEHASVWFGAVPVMTHEPASVYAGAIAQSTPGPPGSGSSIVTFFATPGPAFDAVMVKPMLSPVFTEPASAVFVIPRPGPWTSTESCAVTAGPLPESAVATLT